MTNLILNTKQIKTKKKYIYIFNKAKEAKHIYSNQMEQGINRMKYTTLKSDQISLEHKLIFRYKMQRGHLK